MPRRLGIIPHAYAQPLFAGLGAPKGSGASSFELVTDSSAALALKLRQGNLDGAFLSPADFARLAASDEIVQGSGVVSRGASGTILLLLGEGKEDLSRVAFDPAFGSEAVLLHLMMAEKYDQTPTFVPLQGTTEEALARVDAVLVAGDEAVRMRSWNRKLDVVDEWEDATGLAYVHGLWVVREDRIDDAAAMILEHSGALADARRPDADDGFHFTLSQEDLDAFSEFLRIAYYHGVLKDIPDIRLLRHGGADNFTATN